MVVAMKMMKKLLSNVGKSWDKIPKDIAVIEVSQGSGGHSLVTIEDNSLYFHSQPYTSSLPIKQQIILEDLTLPALVEQINSLGYISSLSSEALKHKLQGRKAFTLSPIKNQPIRGKSKLTTFTSKLWETLYPLARLLEDTDRDIDTAISQMFVSISRGKWLDYWASFFNVKRLRNEEDSIFLRRMLMLMFNTRTNNVAIEELLRYRLRDNSITVNDISPAEFEVMLNLGYSEHVGELYELVNSVKGAGINYLLTYMNLEHDGDFVLIEYKDYDFGVPYPITNVLHTDATKGVLFDINPTIVESFYPSVVEYPKCNIMSVDDTRKGILQDEELSMDEDRYAFTVMYPICNTFSTFNIANISDRMHFTVVEDYRDSDVVYKRAGSAFTGEGEI